MGNRSAAGPVTRFGTFAEAAAHFETAYEKDMSRPNLLRSAAEMHIRAGNKERAIVHLKLASKQLPGNRNVRKRLLVVKYPFLKRVFGESEFPVNV